MAHYQVTLTYDGTGFFGFQRQGNTRTVQSVVEEALRSLGWGEASILAAGRTDTGVHASGQVISFELNWKHTAEALCKALNAHLPADVAARSASVARDDFHPRYDARSRTYIYRLFCEMLPNPLAERYAWRLWPPVNLEAMEAASRLLIGKHDFAAFATPPRPKSSTIRTVFEAGWLKKEEVLHFQVTANAFLYHMVRRMVYLQVLVGMGRLPLNEFGCAVENQGKQPPGLAPAHGLSLVSVKYEEPA